MRRISGIVQHSIQHQRRRNIVDIHFKPLSHENTIHNSSSCQHSRYTVCMVGAVYCASIFLHFPPCIVVSLRRKEDSKENKRRPPFTHVVFHGPASCNYTSSDRQLALLISSLQKVSSIALEALLIQLLEPANSAIYMHRVKRTSGIGDTNTNGDIIEFESMFKQVVRGGAGGRYNSDFSCHGVMIMYV